MFISQKCQSHTKVRQLHRCILFMTLTQYMHQHLKCDAKAKKILPYFSVKRRGLRRGLYWSYCVMRKFREILKVNRLHGPHYGFSNLSYFHSLPNGMHQNWTTAVSRNNAATVTDEFRRSTIFHDPDL